MKKAWAFAIAVTAAIAMYADWPSSSGNAQRDGWARNEKGLSREQAVNGGIKHLYSAKLDSKPQRVGTPVMITNIITWKGFKALTFIGGTSDVYAIDSEIGRPYFTEH